MAISRLYPHASGDLIEAQEWNEEVNQIIGEVNAKPDKDGTLQAQLNADLVDGKEPDTAGTAGGLAVNNGTLMQNLNADLLDGLHASEISEGAFAPGTRIVFAGDGAGSSTIPSGWSDVTPSSGVQALVLTCHASDAVFTGGWGSVGVGEFYRANPWTDSQVVSGAGTFTMTAAQMPAHNHVVQDGPNTSVNLSGSGDSVVNRLGVGISSIVSEPAGGNEPTTVTVSSEFGTWRPPHLRVEIGEKD